MPNWQVSINFCMDMHFLLSIWRTTKQERNTREILVNWTVLQVCNLMICF